MDHKIKQIILDNDMDGLDTLMHGRNASCAIALVVKEIVDELQFDIFRDVVNRYDYYLVYLIAAILSTNYFFIDYLFRNYHRRYFDLLVKNYRSILDSKSDTIVKNLIYIMANYCNLHQAKKIFKILLDKNYLDYSHLLEIESKVPDLLSSSSLMSITTFDKIKQMDHRISQYLLKNID